MISIINAGIKTMLGDGSAGNPYQIRTSTQLAALATVVNAGAKQAGVYYDQTADIDLAGYANWTPIGTSENRFFGIYDGNGFSIYNLICTSDRAGLFGYVSGTLKNMGIESGTVTGTSSSSVCGGICVQLSPSTNASIIGCYNKASVIGVSTGAAFSYIGAICGFHYSNGSISDCVNFGSVTNNSTSSGIKVAGGINGYASDANRSIIRCLNSGEISGNGTVNAISGSSATLTNCYFDNQTSLAVQTGATGRTTVNSQGIDALTDVNKLNTLGTTYWFARTGYPLPIRFQKNY